MQSPLLPFADELTRLTDRQLCEIANQPLDDTVSDLPTIVLDCDDNANEIVLISDNWTISRALNGLDN